MVADRGDFTGPRCACSLPNGDIVVRESTQWMVLQLPQPPPPSPDHDTGDEPASVAAGDLEDHSKFNDATDASVGDSYAQDGNDDASDDSDFSGSFTTSTASSG